MNQTQNEDIDRLRVLAHRHIKTCELVYRTAIDRGDQDIAEHVARSAMSVSFNCYKHLKDESARDSVITWNERLTDLWVRADPPSDYLNRAMKWSTGAMSYFFTPLRDEDNVDNEEARDVSQEEE